MAPLFLFLMLPLNIAIVSINHSIFYSILLILQILFYLSGYYGYYLSTKKIKNKFLFIPYYFLFMNINVIRGFRYLINKKDNKGTWEKAKRA